MLTILRGFVLDLEVSMVTEENLLNVQYDGQM